MTTAKKYLSIEAEQIKAFLALEIEGPLFMYNLLKYKEQVDEMDLTGAQVYRRYLKAAAPFFAKVNAEVVFKGTPGFTLIGPSDEIYWDEILIVKYAEKKDFWNMISDKEYPTALREKALVDSRLIFCKSHQK